jgi:hypothetical protein
MIRWLNDEGIEAIFPDDPAPDDSKTVILGRQMTRREANIADQIIKKRVRDYTRARSDEDPVALANIISEAELDQVCSCISEIRNAPDGATLTDPNLIRSVLAKRLNNRMFAYLFQGLVEGSRLETLEKKD